MKSLPFNPKEIYEFLISRKKGAYPATETLLSVYYSFSIFNPFNLNDTTYRYHSRSNSDTLLRLQETISKNEWDKIPNPNKDFFPLKNNSIDNVLNNSKLADFKALYEYFISKEVDIVYENYKETSSSLLSVKRVSNYARDRFIRNNTMMFRAIKYYDYNVKDEPRKSAFLNVIDNAATLRTKEFQQEVLTSLEASLSQGIEREKALESFCKFIRHNKTLSTKATEAFKSLKEKFSDEELKSSLSEKEYNELLAKENSVDGIVEKVVEAKRFILDITKIKDSSGISMVVLQSNIGVLAGYLEEILGDIDDYVSSNVKTKQGVYFEVLYEKNGSGNSAEVTKQAIKYCLGLKETLNTKSSFKDDLYKLKNATILNNKLNNKLGNNVVSNKRNKI